MSFYKKGILKGDIFMNVKKVFCEECRNDVEFSVTDKYIKGTIKGETYTYFGKIAHCIECCSEIYVEKINNFNLKTLYDKYRKENGIVPLDIILKIPDKYGIENSQFSLLLGWGEETFSRYYNGDIPIKQYSKILQKIYDEPKYYEKFLDKNKRNLKNEEVYSKSKKVVTEILSNKINKIKIL